MFTKGRKLHDFGAGVGSHAEWVAVTTENLANGKSGTCRFMRLYNQCVHLYRARVKLLFHAQGKIAVSLSMLRLKGFCQT